MKVGGGTRAALGFGVALLSACGAHAGDAPRVSGAVSAVQTQAPQAAEDQLLVVEVWADELPYKEAVRIDLKLDCPGLRNKPEYTQENALYRPGARFYFPWPAACGAASEVYGEVRGNYLKGCRAAPIDPTNELGQKVHWRRADVLKVKLSCGLVTKLG